MILTKPHQYRNYDRTSGKTGRYYQTGGRPLPSVTTILGKTGDKTALDDWRERVGPEEADYISKQSADIGSNLHDNLEKYILYGSNPTGLLLTRMLTTQVIKNGLVNVDEVWGTEVMLFSADLYAGTTDLVGKWKKKPAILDFKNSRGIKQEEWILDYYLQLVAYAIAHNEMYGTDIQTCVVMIACWTGHYLEYVIEGDDFHHYKKLWYDRLYMYYDTFGFE